MDQFILYHNIDQNAYNKARSAAQDIANQTWATMPQITAKPNQNRLEAEISWFDSTEGGRKYNELSATASALLNEAYKQTDHLNSKAKKAAEELNLSITYAPNSTTYLHLLLETKNASSVSLATLSNKAVQAFAPKLELLKSRLTPDGFNGGFTLTTSISVNGNAASKTPALLAALEKIEGIRCIAAEDSSAVFVKADVFDKYSDINRIKEQIKSACRPFTSGIELRF